MASEPREVWGDLAISAFVQANHLFKSLDPEAVADLLRLARFQVFAPGETVIRCGGEGDEFFLVMDGRAVVSVDRGARAIDLGHLDRGAFFGEGRLLTGAPYSATVTAGDETTVVRFPAAMVAALANRFPKMGQLLRAVWAAREKENQAKLSA